MRSDRMEVELTVGSDYEAESHGGGLTGLVVVWGRSIVGAEEWFQSMRSQ